MNTAARVTLTAATVALLAIPTDLVSCGPFIPQAIFVASRGTVAPRADYQRHYIGIVSRDWYTEPLIMAYRYTSGLDLSQMEIAALYPGKKRGVGRTVNDPPTTPIEIWLDAAKPSLTPSRSTASIPQELSPSRIVTSNFKTVWMIPSAPQPPP